MIDNRVTPRASATRLLAGTTLFLTAVLLTACSRNSEFPAGSRLRIYAADTTGVAKLCEPSKINPAAGSASEATIKVANDGGWCGFLVHQDGPKPFDAGLLTTRASHGSVTIHEVGDDTRIDYTPDRAFAGKDAFVVKLLPGDATVHVAVTVMAPQS